MPRKSEVRGFTHVVKEVPMNSANVGLLIRKKRQEMNMTQKELAEKLGVTDKAVSQWERGICFPDICIIETITKELNISLTEIFTDSKESNVPGEEMDTVIRNTLSFAEDNFHQKIKGYKKTGLILFAFPLVIFIVMLLISFFLIKMAPDTELTATFIFIIFAFWLYIIRLGLPILLSYLLFLWKYSKFMSVGKRVYIKSVISFIGMIIVLVWLYESLKIIIPNLIS